MTFPILPANSASTGYNLTRSLRFRSSASAYLNRTYVASPTDYRKYTFSAWVKLGALGVSRRLIDAGSGSDTGLLNINSDGTLEFAIVVSGSGTTYLKTNNVLRDPSAWYHIVFSCDTSVGSNQFKFYVNNVQASYSTNTAITTNYGTYLNSGSSVAQLGRSATYGQYFDGYLTEAHFVDGQALTPSSFGETDLTTGVWKPKRYAGTYGTNGFYLPFTDNSALTTSSNVGLGKDFSGNGNYWTTNNISITAGVTYDSMTDVPTLTSATAANFAVLNPLNSFVNGPNATLSNGNLLCSSGIYQAPTLATMQLPTTGKYYWEITVSTVAELAVGINAFATASPTTGNYSTRTVYYRAGGASNSIYIEGTVNAFAAASYTNGDVIAVAYDSTTPSITFYKNNVSQGTYTLTSTANLYPYLVQSAGSGQFVAAANFGQRPFAYTPPSGFVALNTFNLPTSTIVKGNTVMDATLWTGNGASLSVTNAASFKPDFVWLKSRSAATNNVVYDSVRGSTKQLIIALGVPAETTESNGLTAFNSNGFSVGSLSTINTNAATYVGWQWQAGQGTTSSNTNGTITSTVSVNASAGFSVATYTGTGVNGATVGHGLGVAPSLIFAKARSTAGNSWQVYHSSLGNTGTLFLEKTDAVSNSSNWWNNTSPTSSVFSLGTSGFVNANTTTYVAYCWTPIAGYSAFGSYSGSGSTDGPFIYTGFQPKWVLIKASSTTSQWVLWDTARNTYNVTNSILYPNLSAAEASFSIDILSNGFKFREAGGAGNDSGVTYIYAAFATSPFKNSLAR